MSRRRSRGKAITPASVARQGGRVRDVSTDVTAMTEAPQRVPAMARLLPTPQAWATMPFGPGRPLDPTPINPVRADSGRPEPRLYEYPVTWNLSGNNQKLVPWSVLRSAADGVSMFRRCIEVRKDHMRGLDWDIVIGQDALDAAQRKADRAERASKKGAPPQSPPDQATTNPTSPDRDVSAGGRAAVEDEMRDRLAGDIDAAKKFMRVPDRSNGTNFESWLGKLLEEVFVLDALAIYPQYTPLGELYGLQIVDGSTVKPLLDERGGRPQPPYPAYQQWTYGFARGDFTATVSETTGPNGEDVLEGTYRSDELIYLKRVERVWSPYGLSAVEQALDDGALYLKRHLWMMSEYTDGTSVAGLFTTDALTNWSPEQLLEFEIEFNRMFAGQTAERRSARFLPPGVVPADAGSIGSDAIAEKYKPEYDMYLLKLMVSHFDTTLPEIGFTDASAGGLGAAGYHEGQENVQMRKRLPIIKFVEALITGILHDHFGSPDEIEFKFLGLDDEDEPGAVDVDIKRQQAGWTTVNEERDKLGLSRYEFPEADMPMVSTGRGVIFLEGSSLVAPAGTMVSPAAPVPEGAPGAPPSSPPTAKPAPTAPPGADVTVTAAPTRKAAEVGAYRRWLAKGARGRPFRWEHHDPAEVEALTKAGGASDSPKAPWPGWSRDLLVMERYAPKLSRALTGAIGAPMLAAHWAEHGGSPDSARAWLAGELEHGARIAAVLTPVVHRLWTEGYLIGDVSAQFMLRQLGSKIIPLEQNDLGSKIVLLERNDLQNLEVRQSGLSKDSSLETAGTFDHATDWGAWSPGDARAAAAVLHGGGRYPGLARMLERGDVTINGIASHRVDELARVLSQAAAEGWGNGKTAAVLRGVLDDPRWAKMVAVTEVSRASSASALARYRDNGVDAKSWMTASDQRVCPECEEDGAQGDIPIGDYFQDGSDAPPGHPTCRCSIAPGWLPLSDSGVSAGGGGGFDLGDMAGLSEEDAGLGLTGEGDEWATEVEEVLAEAADGAVEGSPLGGSTGANVHRVETRTGRVLVSKTPKDPHVGADETEDAAHQRDAEVLGARVARAVGLDAPVVAQRGDELLMTFMPGDLAESLDPAEVSRILHGESGDVVRLLDLLIDNNDRNWGNFVLGENDRIGVFDHGLAFMGWSEPDVAPTWRGDSLLGWATDGEWSPNRLTPGDVAALRNRLSGLERAFAERGRRDWFDKMTARLDAIGEHASGTVDVL